MLKAGPDGSAFFYWSDTMSNNVVVENQNRVGLLSRCGFRAAGLLLVLQPLDGKTFTDPETHDTYQFDALDGYVWLKSDRPSSPIRVDWLFGSGHHAMTPVTVVSEPDGDHLALQQVMSWYPDDSIGWTLGMNPHDRENRGIYALANPHTAQESRSCFLCHTTWLPENQDQLVLEAAIPNVTCTRCHPQAEQHIQHPDHGSIERWAELSALESVNRCGECHRRADHFTADELVTSNLLLVRFASASLVQSACFTKQSEEQRLDCMTCHDPHQPASTEPAFYNQQCLQCHSSVSQAHCRAANSNDQCIRCHMPKVEVHDGLSFTDHWIRVREASAGDAVKRLDSGN